MKILVTGGAGFIGSALVRRLVAVGHEVRVLDDFSRGNAGRLEGVRCELRGGDVRDRRSVAYAVAGCDMVFHLAAVNGTASFYTEPRRVIDTAIVGTMNVLGACDRYGVRDLLLMSSSEAHQAATVVPTPEMVPLVVPDPLNPRYSYGGGKIAAEVMAAAAAHEGVLDRLLIARPHNVIGPQMGYDHVVPQFALRMNRLAGEHPGVIPFAIQGTGAETRSFCWIGDCVEQLALLLAKAPQGAHVYHVGTMDERTVADTARTVADCYGRAIEVIPGELQPGSPRRRCPDTAKIEALGYKPAVMFAEAVGQTVAWYQHKEGHG